MTSNVQENNDEMEDTNFLDHHLAFFVFLVVASLVFLISIVTLIFRKKLVEIGLCPRWILHVMAEERSPRQVNEGNDYYETERNERKDWYEYFLQPYTTIVKEEDFVLEDDEDGNTNPKLRIQYPQDGTIRFFDSQCAICVSKYRRGDRIVRSGLDCNHAFHYDCIFPWLVKGKKRCPVCRDWFVPGKRIEDQRKELGIKKT